MKTAKRSTRNVGFALGSALVLALTGCTTYVEQEPARTVYASPPPETPAAPVEPPVVVIQTENDFYEPLSPYGSWVIVGSYGRCWKPARVETGWRPYCDGHWQRRQQGRRTGGGIVRRQKDRGLHYSNVPFCFGSRSQAGGDGGQTPLGPQES